MAISVGEYEGISLSRKRGGSKRFDTKFTKTEIKAILKELAQHNGEIRTDAETITKELLKRNKVLGANRIGFELKQWIHINNAVVDFVAQNGKEKANEILHKAGLSTGDFLGERVDIDVNTKKILHKGSEVEVILLNARKLDYAHKTESSWRKCLCSEFGKQYLNRE